MKLAAFLLLSNVSLSEAARLQASDDLVVNMNMNGDGNTVNFNPANQDASSAAGLT